MSWKQCKSGMEWRRPAGLVESLMTKYYGLSFTQDYAEYHLSFSTTYQQKGILEQATLSESVLKQAWTALRFSVPDLCVTHDISAKQIVYQVPDAGDLQAWIERTLRIRKFPAEPDNDFRNLEHEKEMCLYHYPHRSELIMRGPHWNIDGIGISMLTNCFYEQLEAVLAGSTDSLAWGDEVKRLTLSVDEALQLAGPDQAPPDVHAYADKQIQDLFGNRPSLGLAYEGDVDKKPGQPHMQTHVYSAESTKSLIDVCRAKSFTVTSALHTALILQTYRLAPSERKDLDVVDGLPLDHRKYFPPPFNGPMFAMKTCVTTLPICVPSPAHDTYETLATSLANIYKNDFDVAMQTRSWATMCARWDPLFDFKPPAGFPLPSSVMLSNSGILEDYLSPCHEHIKILEADMYAEVVSRNTVINVQTWGGKLHLNLEYNRAYYSDHLMKSFLTGVHEVLQQGLNVKLELESYTT